LKYPIFVLLLFFAAPLVSAQSSYDGTTAAEPPFIISDYLRENLRYPEEARVQNIQGRVQVRFIIDEQGMPTDVHTLTRVGGGLEEEAIRVIKAMPPWKPGRNGKKPVKIYYTLPISFSLESSDSGEIYTLRTLIYDVNKAPKDSLDKRPPIDSVKAVSLFTVKAVTGKIEDILIERIECTTCNDTTREAYRKRTINLVSKMPERETPPEHDEKYRLPVTYFFYRQDAIE
jgi:TonB family protein